MSQKVVILSIDDEPSILQIRSILLEQAGYDVVNAENGIEALLLFDSQKVDLVLLDYYMPEMNGAAVAAEMKLRKPSIPIIMVSASIDIGELALSTIEGFVSKGQGPEILLDQIAKLTVKRDVTRAA